jgi:D-3-phosphoglycerate dehydrogenase
VSGTRTTQRSPTVVVVDPRGAAFSPAVVALLTGAGCEVVTSTAKDEDEVIATVRDADGIIFTGTISRRFIEALTRCRVIARTSIGMDIVDGADLATEKGIVLCNMPGIIEEEVADHTWALVLAVGRRLLPIDGYVRSGGWGRGEPVPAHDIPRMYGSTMGLVGFGRIGRAVARRALGFGMRVIAHDPLVTPSEFVAHSVEVGTLGEVLQDSDVVSLHVPLTPETFHLIGTRELAMMRRQAILINTARGPVVQGEALVEALGAGTIAGAGLDVAEEEPVAADHPLCKFDNVVLSPHWASRSRFTEHERHIRPAQEVIAVLGGLRPRAAWNREVLEGLGLR